MDFSPSIKAAAHAAAEKYPGDLETAKEVAYQEIMSMPEAKEQIEQFMRRTVSHLVYQARMKIKNAMRKGEWPGWSEGISEQAAKRRSQPPLDTTKGKAIKEIYAKHFDYMIGGTRLGSIRGSDIPAMQVQMRNKADGIMRDHYLLDLIKPLVAGKEDKTVDEAVKGKDLDKVFAKFHATDEAA